MRQAGVYGGDGRFHLFQQLHNPWLRTFGNAAGARGFVPMAAADLQ